MSSRTQTDQPFQVVTQKRPSGQARKLSSRDRPPVPRSSAQSEEASTTGSSPASSAGGASSRKRHSRDGGGGGGGGKHSGSRSSGGGSSVQGRGGRDGGEVEGGGEGRGHTNRHSWDPETAQQYQMGSRTHAEKIERSQSARFDRVATMDTNNRFERLNPDAEAPGDQPARPSPGTAGGGGGRGRKRTSRSVSGVSSYRSKSPKRKSGKEAGKGEREGGRERETAIVSCELEWDSGSHGDQESGDVFVNGGVSPVKESPLTTRERQGSLELPSSSVDKASGASAQGGSGEAGGEGGTLANEAETSEQDGGTRDETKTRLRLTYTREELLGLKDHGLSLKKPESFLGKFFRQGKWCVDAWLTQQNSCDDKDEPEEGETGDSPVGKTLPKLKNPTTLSIIREHDARVYGKVCLSPQRRSFGSGCSWSTGKDSNSTGTSSSSANSRDPPFDGSSSESRRGPRSGAFQSHHHSNHTHSHGSVVKNHAPLRDHKSWKGEGGGRMGERERGKAYGGFRTKEMEEEPEWMSFGPSDRSEVIELVGLEEHERGRDGGRKKKERRDRDADVVCGDVEEVGEGGSEGGRGGGVSEEEGSTKTSEGSVGVEEGVVGVVRPVIEGRGENGKKELENEFMLDGFDFSSSVSMCQALASDEEEERAPGVTSHRGGGGSRPLPKAVTDPNELSSALMKALRVGEKEEEAYRHASGHPANALTLEEVHERENISHHHAPHFSSSSHLDPTDQSAFNRLVAVLQSSGAIQDEPIQPPLLQKLPRPSVPLGMPRKLQDHTLSGRLTTGGRGVEPGSFGYMLEKEMRFDEEFSTSSSPHLPPRMPPSVTLHHREPLINSSSLLRESYGSHSKPLFPTPHPHQAPPLSGRPSTLHDKWVERSWIHPESTAALEYGGLHRAPVDPLGLPLIHPHPHPHHHHHHHHHQSGRQVMGGGRPPPNSWAIEMEQRRQAELQSMREREARERGAAARERFMGGGDMSLHHQALPSKPNISLLPTAVMRQLHNSNPAHSLSDIASRSSQSSSSDRMDQDMGGRSAYTHSAAGYGYPEGLGGGRSEYPYQTTHSRVLPRPQHREGMGLYAPPPQYLPVPHGMSSQQQNPYLH